MTADVSRAYQRCTVAVMDTTDPEIEFDEYGVSSYVPMFEESYAPTVRRAQTATRALFRFTAGVGATRRKFGVLR